MPNRYRKKSVEIDAWQWTDENEADDIAEWCNGQYDGNASGSTGPHGEDWGCLEIDTLEGTMSVAPYDYVIRGVVNEHYPCKPDVFVATYDPVAADE